VRCHAELLLAPEKYANPHRIDASVGSAGTVEDIKEETLAAQQVDVLVSEWMGYALLFESMLPSVLQARDRFLKPGGAMLPDRARIFACACDESATGLEFWDDVYGFAFPDIKHEVLRSCLHKPIVAPVSKNSKMSDPVVVQEFDLVTMGVHDCDFHTDFDLAIARKAECRCIVLWFDALFSARFCSEMPVVLSTSVAGTQTHWAQTVLLLRDPVAAEEGDILHCRLSFAGGEEHRMLIITLESKLCRQDGSEVCASTSMYDMSVSYKAHV
jgi:type I protein arginine methyltransferase